MPSIPVRPSVHRGRGSGSSQNRARANSHLLTYHVTAYDAVSAQPLTSYQVPRHDRISYLALRMQWLRSMARRYNFEGKSRPQWRNGNERSTYSAQPPMTATRPNCPVEIFSLLLPRQTAFASTTPRSSGLQTFVELLKHRRYELAHLPEQDLRRDRHMVNRLHGEFER